MVLTPKSCFVNEHEKSNMYYITAKVAPSQTFSSYFIQIRYNTQYYVHRMGVCLKNLNVCTHLITVLEISLYNG